MLLHMLLIPSACPPVSCPCPVFFPLRTPKCSSRSTSNFNSAPNLPSQPQNWSFHRDAVTFTSFTVPFPLLLLLVFHTKMCLSLDRNGMYLKASLFPNKGRGLSEGISEWLLQLLSRALLQLTLCVCADYFLRYIKE